MLIGHPGPALWISPRNQSRTGINTHNPDRFKEVNEPSAITSAIGGLQDIGFPGWPGLILTISRAEKLFPGTAGHP